MGGVVRKHEGGIISQGGGKGGSHMRRGGEPKRSEPSDNSGTGSWKVLTLYNKLLILPPFLQPGELKGNNGEIPMTVFDCRGGAPPKSANFSKENVQPFKGGGGIPPSLLEKFTQHGVLG